MTAPPTDHLQVAGLGCWGAHIATLASVQLDTIIAAPSQSAAEQKHTRVSLLRQHFCPAALGQESPALSASTAGRDAVGPHWQKPSVASLLHANASQVHNSALPQQTPCSPMCVATDARLQALRSSGSWSRVAHRHPDGV